MHFDNNEKLLVSTHDIDTGVVLLSLILLFILLLVWGMDQGVCSEATEVYEFHLSLISLRSYANNEIISLL